MRVRHLFLLLIPVLVLAQTAPEKFAAGLHAYRAKDYAKAKAELQETVQLAPESPSAYYNLALAESKLGEKGLSLAHLRKAISLEPGYTDALKALQQLSASVDRPFASREQSNWEVLRTNALQTVAPQTYLGLALALTLLTGWLLIGYIGRRRKAMRDEQALPGFPVVGTVFGAMLIVVVFLSVAQGYDYLNPRGTILKDKSAVKSSPVEDSTTLFELNQGVEVLIRDTNENWAQVTYPGGMTGWIVKDNLMPSSGRAPW